ncbi:MAG TPA: hypothetical protein VFU19_14975 [Iamia sp.]|nr:hypothetical protein [Iamia sp.]
MDVVVAACEWCGDALSSPYLRRPDGSGLHVACAKDFARTTTGRRAGTG